MKHVFWALLIILNLTGFKAYSQTPLAPKATSPVIELDTTLPNGEPVRVRAILIEQENEAERAAKNLIETESAKNTDLIIVSDLPADKALAGINLLPNNQNQAKRLGLFEIYGETRAQKINTLLFITAQTALSSFSYIVLSSFPLETALIASAITGSLNFYFGADPERWPRLLKWAQDHYRKGAAKTKSQRVGQAVETVGPLQTTFAWSSGWGFVLAGVASWTQFAATFLSIDVITRVVANSALATSTSGTWEALFAKWKNNSSGPLTDGEIIFARRLRSLISAVVVPLAQAGLPIGSLAISAMATTGISAYLADLTPARIKANALYRTLFDQAYKVAHFLKMPIALPCRLLF